MQAVPAQHSGGPAASPASDVFCATWLRERGIDKSWGVFVPLDPVVLPMHSRWLGGDGRETACFMLVTFDPDDKPNFRASRTRFDTGEKDWRYRSKRGSGCVVYANLPGVFARWAEATEKHIGEGEGKTCALYGAGKIALGIGGVQNWRGPDGKLLPELASRIRPGDTVTMWIDGDWESNRDVHMATYLLMAAIRELGAKPLLPRLPPPLPGLPKLGIDDLIKTWRDRGLDVQAQLAALPMLEELADPFVVDVRRPMDTAENFLRLHHAQAEGVTLRHWQEDFYRWRGPGWERYADELIKADLYEFIRQHGPAPNKGIVESVLHALRSVSQARTGEAPAWVEGSGPQTVLPMGNGLLDLETGELLPATPRFFNLAWSQVPYDPGARCPRWLEFLSEVYPDDPQARDCLQEFLGYSLTNDTSHQKAIALIGAKRSGKGTIARIVQELVGRDSVVTPTLQSAGENFGWESCIGKRVVMITDARVSARNNTQAMVERVLTVTGEDTQTIPRKHKADWIGRLRAKLWLVSNMLPATQDKGGALASRFLILNHTVSFLGREDPGLEGKLLAEASGILNWALEGLERLQRRGYFLQPESGHETVREWERLNSPMLAFVQDQCEVGGEFFVPKTVLRNAYRDFVSSNSLGTPPTDEHFTQELKAATEQRVKVAQRMMSDGKRVWCFKGIRLHARTSCTSKY